MGTQYLNLYRSMWWLLPKARSQQSLNNHLIIDSDVSQFSLIFIGQSSIIAIIKALMYKTNILSSRFNLLASNQQCHQLPLSTNTTATTYTPNAITTNGPSTCSDSDNKPHHTSNNSQLATLNSQASPASSPSSPSVVTATTIVTALASWICSYYLFRCAYRIWANFGLNGLSFVSYPIVSLNYSNDPPIQVH